MPWLCCWQELVEWPQSIQHYLVHRMHPTGSKQKPASSSLRQSHRTALCISGNQLPNPSFKLQALLFLSVCDYGFLFFVYIILFRCLTLAHGLKCFTFLFELLSFLLFVLYPLRRIIAILIETEEGNNILCTPGALMAPRKFSRDFLLTSQHSVDCDSLPVLSTFNNNIYFSINLVSFHFEMVIGLSTTENVLQLLSLMSILDRACEWNRNRSAHIL